MKWSITQLRKYQGKPFEFDQTVSFDNLKESLDLIDLSPITIQGQLTIKSTEVVADIHITGTYTMPCARTLVPVKVPLDVTTTEVFDLEGYNQYNDGMVNLQDIVEDIVIIEKPMRAYSEQSDQMLTVGNGWEVIDEDQLDELAKQQEQDDSESRQVDPRLQKLQQLYDKEQ
ncbi:YceD family protein [Staphylococcus aureus]|uniref:YceD family protein n=1 Tax=Staphylococcus aureus TaxID=1280 RepID=UPI000687F3F0|nr:DUF177 domain-containing protein [Staphylococcus aureus]MBO8617807.1 DUF177 domain-containing protein [Staphylococcus aureus]MCR0702359.1 DUF177 domain-containing protein [Staphylococcus aureus]MCR0718306.1 DUF177 domain-containing protein [Staphylococcus aureus]MCR0767529.1 DUF177 domain-containing protein [Staphylococcus aureus]MCR0799260.1 DUF177 domain-containing protein [Staphylococcus aureus]